MTTHEKLKDLAELIVMHWGAAVKNDEPIQGSEAVDSVVNYVVLAQDVTSRSQ